MLWFPEERKVTRSGTVFASFLPKVATLLKSNVFDIAPLLRKAIQVESDDQEDLDDPMDDLDEPAAAPMDDSWLDELDEPRPPPPPPKRIRMDEVIASGRKPPSFAHIKRRNRRNKKIAEQGQLPRPATLREHIHQERVIATECDAATLPAAHGGYSAKVGDTWGSKKPRSLQDLLGLGFELIKWDGFESRPIVDVHGRIIAALVGQPRSADYAAAAARVFEAIESERKATTYKPAAAHHRRGDFFALNAGLSYGKGQRVPSRLDNGVHAALLARLLGNADVKRLATFASAAFALWAPNVYNYYKKCDTALHGHLPHLQRNFEKSIFSCATFNFGPDVWTFKHRDVLNLPFGMCAVQALGPFDPTKGGHLVLWELKLVIEFPPGALILIPSATMTHSNVPVQAGELRSLSTLQEEYSATLTMGSAPRRSLRCRILMDMPGYARKRARDGRWG
ncbi:hypothetical protein B0H15DRAFT_807364 [Mycena belliarum]|uniref:Uncharacterized protein n=1 Tax=Mycena belliarum TaxID=1033014 RepID=A0AAD6TPV2_9AGAR|nr:hypothetical protein B0H15DRAFT_807364 [Mycena belliae]